jgi:NSS family neurotransmitter:Na+ symporter
MAAFKQHDNWSSRLTFLMAAIGAAVGLGNIWKFPVFSFNIWSHPCPL